jgi:alkylation response protein AidB-like acyl-CoA dehydrogenase
MTNYALSEDQIEVRRAAAQFAKEHIGPAADIYQGLSTQQARFREIRPFYEKLVKAGYLRSFIPAPFGGTGGSFLDMSLIVEEFWAVDTSVNMALLGTALGLMPLILGGTAEQRDRFMKPFISGEGDHLASLAHSEPGGTANYLEEGGRGLAVTARKEGDEYVVNGEKVWHPLTARERYEREF